MKEAPLVIPGPKVKPKGRYTVELFDAESGVLLETRHVENYISPLYALNMAGMQYQYPWATPQLASNSIVLKTSDTPQNNPTTAYLSGTNSPFSNRLFNPTAITGFPSDALIITDDDTAEDTDSHWLRGRVTAFATRWKATVPASGKRGVVNESESLFSNDGMTHKTVWDFTTQQGNGTFQTLAIGSLMSYDTDAAVQWCAMGPPAIKLDDLIPNRTGILSTGASGFVVVGTTAYWVAPDADSATANVVVYSAPAADIFAAPADAADPYVLDAGATPTTVVDSGVNYASTPSSNNSTTSPACILGNNHVGLTRLGASGDFVIAYIGRNSGSNTSNGGRQVTLRRFTAAGSLVWSTNPITVSTTNANWARCSIVYDGTNLYASVDGGDNTHRGNIYRINPATGALSATLPIPGSALCNGWMTFDGTDLLIETDDGLLRVSTAGAIVTPYGYGTITQTNPADTAVAPWVTTASIFGGKIGRGGFSIGNWAQQAAASEVATGGGSIETQRGFPGVINQYLSVISYGTTQAIGGLVVYGGKLWAFLPVCASTLAAPNGSAVLMAVVGANMVSRTVLESPVTKTSSQNMKITYEITFPESDLTTVPAHLDV